MHDQAGLEAELHGSGGVARVRTQFQKVADVRGGGFDEAATTHVRNFLECVRTRATPTGTVELGFQACLIMQLANLSLKQGRTIRWDAALKKVI